ncbi:tRNA pseudouridine synthase A [gamma proteobacterium IMCC1989]|nr:tRNA pseudouridine synthase A [gamma proteobacterium IMCC1989]
MFTNKKPYKRNCDINTVDGFPEGMQRVALGIEYAGHVFHGFQSQPHDEKTVQSALENALSLVANEPIKLVCAGRTDAGVHATNQIVHFDTLAKRKDTAWLRGANAKLPDGVAIRWAQDVSCDFHSRFSAKHRTYRYVIYNSRTHSALLKNFVTWDRRSLDIDAMAEASQALVGRHDFNAFRASQCQANNAIRDMHYIKVHRQNDFIVIEVQATAFLYHMVRNIVGVLSTIAAGEKPVSWAKEVLESKDRRCGGITASPDGLYLVAVEYDESHRLPQRPKGPYFLAT